MKKEIRVLIEDGRVPLTISSFRELHDYCDANCLGGHLQELCDISTGRASQHSPDPFAALDSIGEF